MNREIEYLQIPESYFSGADDPDRERFATLAWTPAGDIIEWADGTTFLFAAQVALFLEGYLLVGPLIHFAHILHILQIFDKRLGTWSTEAVPIRDLSTIPRMKRETVLFFKEAEVLVRAYQQEGSQLRNLGALCAYLCREIPPVVDSPHPEELKTRLSHGVLLSAMAVQRWQTSAMASNYEAPSVDADEFKNRFVAALRALSPSSITEWLRHGRGSAENQGSRIAEVVKHRTARALSDVLATLEARERLADARPMIGQLVSALTLPPRRLAHCALPSGGYADVATRGRPEQILPSQFAIDDIEFLRRFAENELLYFHREEPHSPVTEQLVVLIDQGVRTWGRVRHALSAAAIALGRLADRRKMAFLVGGTSSDGQLLDPILEADAPLGALWEATDLSPNPSLALERILDDPHEQARDVVVLSHPRNVAEAEFAAATLRSPPGTRIFSVAVDLSGSVEFREWRRGIPVKLGDYRVEIEPKAVVPQPRSPFLGFTDPACWKGDVEPVPYPFRFGVIHRIDKPLFSFDHVGRWLLFSTHHGILNAWSIQGTASEVLPRGMVNGQVLEQVETVIGVAGGFVVTGRVGKTLAAVHYDFATRTATAFVIFHEPSSPWKWWYTRELHTIVGLGDNSVRMLDLSNREVSRWGDPNHPPSSRASRAFNRLDETIASSPWIAIDNDGITEDPGMLTACFDRASGTLHVVNRGESWRRFTPLADGQPSLRYCWLDHAQLRGNVLAVVVTQPDRTSSLLKLFHGPSGVPCRDYQVFSFNPPRFILSTDGKLIARQISERRIEIHETSGTGAPLSTTPKGKTHGETSLVLGPYAMVVVIGKISTLIRWDESNLDVDHLSVPAKLASGEPYPWAFEWPADRETRKPAVLDYDPGRFVICARGLVTAVVDIFGQISVFDRDDRLVAMFQVFRGQVRAWLPDGTRSGPGHDSGSRIEVPASHDAARLIGRRLKEASDLAGPPFSQESTHLAGLPPSIAESDVGRAVEDQGEDRIKQQEDGPDR